MTMKARQQDLLVEAQALADQLYSPPHPVKRNSLLTLVADFMATPSPDPVRLVTTLRLVRENNGGHLDRQGSFPEQAQQAIDVLLPMLEGTVHGTAELKTLFGWTARRLVVGERLGSRVPPSSGEPTTAPPSRLPKPQPMAGVLAEALKAAQSKDEPPREAPLKVDTKLSVEVLERAGSNVRIRIEDTGQELIFNPRAAWTVGNRYKVKIKEISSDGKLIKKVVPG